MHRVPLFPAELSRGGLRDQESQAVRLPGGQGPRRRPHRRHLRLGSGPLRPGLRLPPAPVRRAPLHRGGPGRRHASASPASATAAATAASRGPPTSSPRSSATSTPSRACRPRSPSPAERRPLRPADGGPTIVRPGCIFADGMRPGRTFLCRTCPCAPCTEVTNGAGDGRCDARGGAQNLTSAPSATCRQRFPTVRSDAQANAAPSPGPAQADGGRRCSPRARPRAAVRAPLVAVGGAARRRRDRAARAHARRRRARAPPPRPATLVKKAAEQLTVIDEQVRQAELTVAAQQQAADGRRRRRPPPPRPPSPPTSRSCGPSRRRGYTDKTQSRVAAFLTSDSAAELVQQMTTLDMIAEHTNTVIS